ncbi:MAG: hypothetical protein FJ150_07475 [Euryarchaeota archaeon]|nr:hypothetical protein [Euryarchaeota archaeon]
MWKISKWIFLVTTVPLLTVGIIFLILGFMASPEALTDDGYSLKNFYYTMGGAFVIFPLITTIGVLLYYRRINVRETNLIQNGIRGEAEILHQEQTGSYLNELPQVKFQLEVTLSDGDIYQIEHKDYISMLDLNSIGVGRKLPVFVDPNNQKNLLLIYS